MDEKVSIRVNVADRYYPLKIEAEDEERIRKAAKMINEKVLQYKQRYTDKDVQDFLAMAALQYVIKALELENGQDLMPVLDAVAAMGCDLSAHRSGPLRYEQLLEAEKIVCLTDNHKAFLLSTYPELLEKTLSFSELTGKSVQDPFGGNAQLYQRSADAITEGVKQLLQCLQA